MENEEKGILVEQVVQADRIRTHGFMSDCFCCCALSIF